MNKPLAIFVLVALISMVACSTVEEDEIRELSKLRPCIDNQAGTRVKHPSNDHKFLRCVSRDSFWIETCPDNLFYNAELDLCDWSTISLTTTIPNDIVVKFRPVLFRNNKTVRFNGRPVDLSRVSVKITPDTEMFPGQEDIIDTLTPTKFVPVRRPSVFNAKPASRNFDNNNVGTSSFGRFSHINNNNNDGVFSFNNNNVGGESFINNNNRRVENENSEEFEAVPVPVTTRRMFTTTERLTTTTEEPITTTERTTTTQRPVIMIPTTRRPIITTTERVIVERPMENVIPVRNFDKNESSESDEIDSESNSDSNSKVEENKDRPVLFRKNHIVTSTKPTIRRPIHRRPVVDHRPVELEETRFVDETPRRQQVVEEAVSVHPHRQEVVKEVEPVRNEQRVEEFVPIEPTRHQVIEEIVPVRNEPRVEEFVPIEPTRHQVVEEVVPVRPHEQVEQQGTVVEQPEIEFTTTIETPVFTTTRRTFGSKIHHGAISKSQLLKQLAEEMPGARVVSFNGKPINAQL